MTPRYARIMRNMPVEQHDSRPDAIDGAFGIMNQAMG
jgi:hypothetical protein